MSEPYLGVGHNPRPTNNKVISVAIDHAQFWKIGQPVHQHIYVGKTLRTAGIPITDGGLELQGVEHGRLTMFNEIRNGKRFCIYEWVPSHDSPAKAPARVVPFDEDDEL